MSGSDSTGSPVRRPSLGLVAILALVIIGLAALDKSLQEIQTADLANTARHAYLTGYGLLQAGEASEAVDFLRDAHALVRENRDYELELIAALMNAGRIADADPLMNEALQRAPNDGRTNLIAARLANKEGRIGDAKAYYHRAIYGEWPGNAAGRRIAARMELIGFLREKASRQELLAELISLEAEAPPDNGIQRSLARLFLAAGAPSRAVDIYQSLIEQNRADTPALAGLGEAELEQGRYREARAAYLQAFFQTPADASIRARLQLLNTVMALDPTPRGLSSAEKYRRSLRILDLTRSSLGQCAARDSSGAGDEPGRFMTDADDALASKAPNRVTNEMAEKVLMLAEEMWRARVKTCGGIPANEDALRLIMSRLITPG